MYAFLWLHSLYFFKKLFEFVFQMYYLCCCSIFIHIHFSFFLWSIGPHFCYNLNFPFFFLGTTNQFFIFFCCLILSLSPVSLLQVPHSWRLSSSNSLNPIENCMAWFPLTCSNTLLLWALRLPFVNCVSSFLPSHLLSFFPNPYLCVGGFEFNHLHFSKTWNGQ